MLDLVCDVVEAEVGLVDAGRPDAHRGAGHGPSDAARRRRGGLARARADARERPAPRPRGRRGPHPAVGRARVRGRRLGRRPPSARGACACAASTRCARCPSSVGPTSSSRCSPGRARTSATTTSATSRPSSRWSPTWWRSPGCGGCRGPRTARTSRPARPRSSCSSRSGPHVHPHRPGPGGLPAHGRGPPRPDLRQARCARPPVGGPRGLRPRAHPAAVRAAPRTRTATP